MLQTFALLEHNKDLGQRNINRVDCVDYCLKCNCAVSTFSIARKAEARFTIMKQEGNDLVKNSQFQGASDKYSECLAIKPNECAIYTNRYTCAIYLIKMACLQQESH